MGPVFEQRAVVFDERGQVRALISLIARKQCHVMRALDGCDAVELDEPQLLDE